jgi:hypothetical protein
VPVGALVALGLLGFLIFDFRFWMRSRREQSAICNLQSAIILALALMLLPTAPFASPPDSRYLYLPVMAGALLVGVMSNELRATSYHQRAWSLITRHLSLVTTKMLRIAIVGCGKVADQHVQAIHRIPECEIVSLCDRELLMARQLGERVGVSNCFSDLREMLETSVPDVVHITTPPQSHFSLAKRCLESGSHVYLEKPFAINTTETRTLIELAQSRGLKITAGHNYQFTLEMLEMRRLIKDGFLGGKPVHLESYWSYDLGDLNYVAAVLGNRSHWVRQLPGQLFHNIISHGIAKLAEFLDDELSEIVALAGQNPELRRLARSNF